MSKRKLDLTNVETYTKMSEGIHRVKVASCEDKTTQAGDDMISIAFEAVNGPDKGARVFDNFVLTDKALWKLKQLLKALGIKCDGKIALDTDKLIGKQCDAEIFHEEYNGQMRARVNEYTKVSAATTDDEDDEDFEEDEAPAPVPKKSTKKQPEPEEDDDDYPFDEDEEEEPPAPKKSKKEQPKKASKKKPEPEPEDDDDDEDWEEA